MAIRLIRPYQGQAANTIYAKGYTPGWSSGVEPLLKAEGGATNVLEDATDFAAFEQYRLGGVQVANGEASALGALGVAPALGNYIAWLGDSFVDRGAISNVSRPTGQAGDNAWGYQTWFNQLTGQKYNYNARTLNFGFSGDTIDQAAVRIPLVIASGARACFVCIGTNNIILDQTAAQIIDKLTNLILKPLMIGGVTPLIYTIPPRGTQTTFRSQQWAAVNTWLREIGTGRLDFLSASGLPYAPTVIDPNDYFEDKTQAAGTFTWLLAETTDYIHPNVRGAFHGGLLAAQAVANLLPPRPRTSLGPSDLYSSGANPRGNQCTNGILAGTGGALQTNAGLTPTGAIAANWTALRQAGSSTATMVLAKENPRTDGPGSGERQKVTVNVTNGSGALELYRISSTNFPVVPGQTIFAQADYEILAGAASVMGCTLTLTTNGTGAVSTVDNNIIGGMTGVLPSGNLKGVLRTNTPIVVPADATIGVLIFDFCLFPASAGTDTAAVLYGDVACRQQI